MDREHDGRFVGQPEVNGVRKPRLDPPSRFVVDLWKDEGIVGDASYYRINRKAELSTEANSPRFIIGVRLQEVLFGFRPEDNSCWHWLRQQLRANVGPGDGRVWIRSVFSPTPI